MGAKEFGDLIRRERERRSLQSKDLADRVGIGSSTMSDYEKGKRVNPPPPSVMNAIGGELAISQKQLLQVFGYDMGEEKLSESSLAARRLHILIDGLSSDASKLKMAEGMLRLIADPERETA